MNKITVSLLILFVLLTRPINAQDAGYALSYDGLDDVVELGDVLNDVDLPLTITAWLNVQGEGTYFPIRVDDNPDGQGPHYGFWFAVKTGNEVSVHYGDGNGFGAQYRRAKRGVGPTLLNEWHHIAVVMRDSGDMDLYVDGVDIGGNYEGSGGPMARNNYPARLGISTLAGPWLYQGLMDEMRIYDRALAVDEIGRDMHRTVDPETDNLVAYWSFNEGEGQVVFENTAAGLGGTLGYFMDEEDADPAWVFSTVPLSTAGCITTAAFASAIYNVHPTRTLRGLTLSDESLLDAPERYIVMSEDDRTNASYVIDDLPEGIEARWNRTWCLDFSDAALDHDGSITLSFDPPATGFEGFPAQESVYRLLNRRGRTGTMRIVTNGLGEPLLATVSEEGVVSFTVSPGSDQVNFNALASGDFTLGVIEIPLPVELVSFEGIVDETRTILTWETASETNNAGFYVERAGDSGRYTQVDFVEGHGTTTNATRYEFVDDVRHLSGTTWHYRLKQVDFDGTFEYSKTLSLTIASTNKPQLHEVYPNPFNAQVVLEYELPVEMNVTISLYDAVGQKIGEIARGQLPAGRHQVNYDASNLASGVYMVRMKAGDRIVTRQITLTK